MNKCKDCFHYKPKDEYKGVCLISKSGHRTMRRSDAQCMRFEQGKCDGLDRNAHNLKIIMDRISKNYKGGRWG